MKKTNTKTNPIIALEIQIEACRKNKQLLQNKIDAVIDIPNRIKALVAKQQKIEAAYRVLKINHLLQHTGTIKCIGYRIIVTITIIKTLSRKL